MAFLQEMRGKTIDQVLAGGGWPSDYPAAVLLDMMDATMNSSEVAHKVFDYRQGSEKKVTFGAFYCMKGLVHRELKRYIHNTATSYPNEAITYCLLLRWIDNKQEDIQLRETEKFYGLKVTRAKSMGRNCQTSHVVWVSRDRSKLEDRKKFILEKVHHPATDGEITFTEVESDIVVKGVGHYQAVGHPLGISVEKINDDGSLHGSTFRRTRGGKMKPDKVFLGHVTGLDRNDHTRLVIIAKMARPREQV